MRYMNGFDIERAKEINRRLPVASRAVQFLEEFKLQVDTHSDGWAYWKLPVQAARKLMELIEDRKEGVDATDAQLKAALVPIKAFYTRYGYKAGMQYPGSPDWTARENAAKANAALQAAAPKLQAALVKIAFLCESDVEHVDGQSILRIANEALRLAGGAQ